MPSEIAGTINHFNRQQAEASQIPVIQTSEEANVVIQKRRKDWEIAVILFVLVTDWKDHELDSVNHVKIVSQ